MSADIYAKMAERILLAGSKIIPELFRMIANPGEAELLMAMPGSPEQLAAKTGRSVEETEAMCKELYHKGLTFKSFKGDVVSYKMCRDMIQFHDATILWPEAPPEYHDLWQKFMEEEWPDFARLVNKILVKPFTRVVPVGQAIETGRQQVLDADSVDRIVQDSEPIAVTRCTCRLIAKKCDKPLEVCLQVGNAARYTIDRGSGRQVSKEEALAILREAEREGLVHVTMNKAHTGHFICNCCSCCCQAFPLLISEGLNLCDPSRFQAEIDPGVCTACGTCEDRCYFNAIEATVHEGRGVRRVIAEKCMGCGLCQITCPENAIVMKEVREISFIPA